MKTRAWLHLVGRGYYEDEKVFETEAKAFGVTRRVSPLTLNAMEFGDVVLVATRSAEHGKAEQVVKVFGQFTIDRLSGLSSEAVEALKENHRVEVIGDGGQLVERECGKYVEGVTATVDAALSEIVETLSGVKDTGHPMVGGTYKARKPVYLAGVPRMRGFRRLNLAEFDKDAKKARKAAPKEIPLLTGDYRVTEVEKPGTHGQIQEVIGYEKA